MLSEAQTAQQAMPEQRDQAFDLCDWLMQPAGIKLSTHTVIAKVNRTPHAREEEQKSRAAIRMLQLNRGFAAGM
jgi:hypothetical protein